MQIPESNIFRKRPNFQYDTTCSFDIDEYFSLLKKVTNSEKIIIFITKGSQLSHTFHASEVLKFKAQLKWSKKGCFLVIDFSDALKRT